jgi:MFS family permease
VGYALMSLMMTAAPLAIVACGYSYKEAGQVIQWHVLAMFLPSLFSGKLIQKLGTVKALYLGALLYFCAAISALTGESIHHFGASMIFLGMAWNFMFVGATTLLAQAYGPAEKAKIQGLNELLVFGTTAWALSFALLGLLSVALMATSWYALSLRRSGKGAAIPVSP